MKQFLILFVMIYKLSSGEEEVNITASQNLTAAESNIHIPSSSEEKNEEISLEAVVLQKTKEFDDIATTPEIPYLPLIQRCSIDSECSSEKACYDGKCLSANRFQLFPYLFHRCQSRIDCPTGNRCIINMCIPFRW